MSINKEIANTILAQMGGSGRINAMIGVKHLTVGTCEEKTEHAGNVGDIYLNIAFKAKAKKVNGKSPNMVRVVYNVAQDLYTMVFIRIHGTTVSYLESIDMVYCDQLKELFEDKTGLYLSL